MSIEREELPVDVAIVGGGPAGLSCAIHLNRLVKAHDEAVTAGSKQGDKFGDEFMIALIEKGGEVGNHQLSGAIMNPLAIKELMPDWLERGAPVESPVLSDEVYFFTDKAAYKFPVTPPPMNNHGNYIISLGRFSKWLAGIAEEEGVNVFTGFAGREVLYDGDNIKGVRTGDKGIDHEGNPRGNFEPGMDITARVTVFSEGTRGSLTKEITNKFHLTRGRNPQIYGTGVKEVWEILPEKWKEGRVIHTMNYPLKTETFGGSFIYSYKDNKICLGFITGLDYKDPFEDPHLNFNLFKNHPFVRNLLEGGKMLNYGAKTVPEGGYDSVPKAVLNGGIIIGDSAGLVNNMKLKGVHNAIKSGMLAAETIFDALLKNKPNQQDAGILTEPELAPYEEKLENSYVKRDMKEARHFHNGFKGGLYIGSMKAGLQTALKGKWPATRIPGHEDGKAMKTIESYYGSTHVSPKTFKPDGVITFDKLTNVFNSGTKHDEHQPCHLQVSDYELCATRCTEEYGNPCEKFCPAAVYEMIPNEEKNRKELRVNFSNCVHCKTCDIKDPYGIINWVTPQGGEGPVYVGM